jgi:transcription elongation factor GreA
MTPQGYQKLREELKRIKEVERPQNIRDLEEARGHGDLSENAEFDAAKDRQGFLEQRMIELENKLARAQVIDPATLSGGRVVFGATVTLVDQDTDKEVVYTIVGEDESDVKQGKISLKSPIARALIGKHVDDLARVQTPGGEKEYEVVSVEFKS